MTLCIAAMCNTPDGNEIIASADLRSEVPWAGADVAFKFSWGGGGWPALLAGDPSKAEDALATFRSTTGDEGLNDDNVYDRLNEASCTYRAKLCDRFIRMKLGMDYNRFLTRGEHELTAEVRNRTLIELTQLGIGCELIIFGFIERRPYIFHVEESGEVCCCQNFACIGTGSVIANSTLYQRAQNAFRSVDQTLYNIYEASKLAQIAPGVGETRHIARIAPSAEDIKVHALQVAGFRALEQHFQEYGPKGLTAPPTIQPSHWKTY